MDYLMLSETNVKVDGAIVAQNWQLVFNTWQLFAIDPMHKHIRTVHTHTLYAIIVNNNILVYYTYNI